jgi:hypothetical protein
LDEGDVGGDIIRQWHKQPKTQVKDTEEALMLLDKWAQEHPSDAVDEYGPAVESPTTASGAAKSTQTVARTTGTGQERTVRVTPAACFVKEPSSASGSETRRDMSESVSIPASSGAAQAASHPSVKHITDTLVRMAYLDDFQNGVFLLRDPLGDETMGRRNKVAKRIKSRADAEKTMLVFCREGKVDEISHGLFWVLHSEGEKKSPGRTKTSSGSGDSQPPKEKPKTSQDKPKVRKSVKSQPARSANLYDGKNLNLRALLAGLPATHVANREKGVHKAPRIDNSGPNPACLINRKVLPVILLDYGAESVFTGRAGARQMGLKPSMMNLGAQCCFEGG